MIGFRGAAGGGVSPGVAQRRAADLSCAVHGETAPGNEPALDPGALNSLRRSIARGRAREDHGEAEGRPDPARVLARDPEPGIRAEPGGEGLRVHSADEVPVLLALQLQEPDRARRLKRAEVVAWDDEI